MYSARDALSVRAWQAAMGPFYCPNDQKVYLDTSFFNEMKTRFRACGTNASGESAVKACEFCWAYVVAHEVGHHVQNLIGVLPRCMSCALGFQSARQCGICSHRIAS